jgi:hypothetical protein
MALAYSFQGPQLLQAKGNRLLVANRRHPRAGYGQICHREQR